MVNGEHLHVEDEDITTLDFGLQLLAVFFIVEEDVGYRAWSWGLGYRI